MMGHFEIAAIFELLTIAAGFMLLHRAKKETSDLLKVAAFILIVGGILLGLGTAYRSFSYRSFYGPQPGMMGPGYMHMFPGYAPERSEQKDSR